MFRVKSKPIMGLIQFFLGFHSCTLEEDKATCYTTREEAEEDINRRALEPYSFCKNDWIIEEVPK